jgi:hypothetical protein
VAQRFSAANQTRRAKALRDHALMIKAGSFVPGVVEWRGVFKPLS